MRRNIFIVLSYDGTRYNGWQKQGNTDNTIQGKLEGVLSRLAGAPVEVHGSGRTDAGVHAKGQCANFHIDVPLSAEEIRVYLNTYLPDDIYVKAAREVPARFHARLNAAAKTYCYTVRTGCAYDVFARRYCYYMETPLDVAAMRRAAQPLLGEHDFMSFCGQKRMKKSTVRRIDTLEIEETRLAGAGGTTGQIITIRARGNGFLFHMVRLIVGTLLEVGAGSRDCGSMPAVLAARNREAAGSLAAAQGLALEEVIY